MSEVTVRDGVLQLAGRPSLLLAGDYPYYRDEPRCWPGKLAAIRAAGLTTVSFYVPWRHHELDGRFVFDGPGSRDLTGFLGAVADAGLFALAKPGPHVHAELPLGGLPDRLGPDQDSRLRPARGPGGAPLRSHGRALPSLSDPAFAAEVDRWLAAAGDALKQWRFPNGPLVAVQAGNEGLYGETALALDEYDPDRELGPDLARFADALGLDVPAFANLSPPAPGRYAAWRARGLPGHPHYGFTNWAGDTATDDGALDRYLLAATRARGPNLEENWSLGWAYPGWCNPATPIFNGLLGLACGATGLTVYTACATGIGEPHLVVPGVEAPYGADAPIGTDATPGPAFAALRVLTHFLAAEGVALATATGTGPVAGVDLIDARRGPFHFLFNRSPEPRRVCSGPFTVRLAGYGVAVLRADGGRLLSAYCKGVDERGGRHAPVEIEVAGSRLTTAGPCDLALVHRAGRPEIRHTGDPADEVIFA
ncbi:beta-galactosidase [Actinoplanes regularis]|uniref:beta-galactosidase n=1 Tax=Actinoplanes regularis TaxID=52697 RepID=UPI0024A0D024|nr:beta-galactosidase [Actinoplanes regularis]GLW28273.1 hypothetical protein Areg01_12130 [Actinoplanes regularis]